MPRNVWNAFVSWPIRQHSNYTNLQHHVLMITNSRTENWNPWENCLKFLRTSSWNAEAMFWGRPGGGAPGREKWKNEIKWKQMKTNENTWIHKKTHENKLKQMKTDEKWKKMKKWKMKKKMIKNQKKSKNEKKWKNEKKRGAPHSYPQLRGLRYCDLANKTPQHVYKVSTPSLQGIRIGNSGRLAKSFFANRSEMPVFGTHW